MPTNRHLRRRHALHAVRFFLLIVHSPLFLHSDIDDKLLYERPKNDWNEMEKRRIEKSKSEISKSNIRTSQNNSKEIEWKPVGEGGGENRRWCRRWRAISKRGIIVIIFVVFFRQFEWTQRRTHSECPRLKWIEMGARSNQRAAARLSTSQCN